MFEVSGKQKPAIVMNFSEIGLFLQTRLTLPKGTRIKITFFDHSDKEIHVEGVVSAVVQDQLSSQTNVKGGLGVELFTPDSAYLEFLQEYKTTS